MGLLTNLRAKLFGRKDRRSFSEIVSEVESDPAPETTTVVQFDKLGRPMPPRDPITKRFTAAKP